MQTFLPFQTSAILAVFAVDIYTAFVWNFIPLCSFMLACYFTKQKYQLIAAFIISIIYSLISEAAFGGFRLVRDYLVSRFSDGCDGWRLDSSD